MGVRPLGDQMCDPFGVQVTRRGEVTFLVVTGELDMATVPAFEEHLRDVEEAGANPLVIDLRGLGFLDSAGIAALMRAHERARAGGRRIAVINGTGQAHRLFQITDADQTIEVIEDAEGLSGGDQ
jgi:anti-sigma B factor antagonist